MRISDWSSDVCSSDLWDVLPLEYLLARPPSVIFSSTAEGRRDRMLSHPTLRRLSEQVAIRDYPPRLLHCAGPAIIDAVTRLSQVRRSVSGQFVAARPLKANAR